MQRQQLLWNIYPLFINYLHNPVKSGFPAYKAGWTITEIPYRYKIVFEAMKHIIG